jgi:hypothetical protein
MVEVFFTHVEASQKLGRKVRSASNLTSVPEGIEGIVVKAIRSRTDDWRVRVHWQVARSFSLIDAGELSFFKREKPALSDLSKSAYEKSVEEIS